MTHTELHVLCASALHNADNALTIARRYQRQEAPQTIDPVQAHIREALNAIAAMIGEKAMLEA